MAGRKAKKKNETFPAHAPVWSLLFLQTLGATGNVSAACKAADVSRATVHRHRAKYPEFADAWDGSMEEALDKLEGVLWREGANGHIRAIELVLKARRPMFREGHKSEVTVNNNSLTLIDGQDPIDLLNSRMNDMRQRMIASERASTDKIIEASVEVLETENAGNKS
mgnify:FL=1|tara:strand:+ start:324 stop:824 length:501 start_codon:yes stop_codon:yes gene_type:complete